MSSSFLRLANVACSVRKSAPVGPGGIREPGSVVIADLRCTPLDPAGEAGELLRRQGLNTPHELLVTFLPGSPNVREGDVLVVAGQDYPIKAVGEYAPLSIGGIGHVRLIVEQLKR